MALSHLRVQFWPLDRVENFLVQLARLNHEDRHFKVQHWQVHPNANITSKNSSEDEQKFSSSSNKHIYKCLEPSHDYIKVWI